jgi:anaerobic selenocysteine-containing dehydrogenase
MFLVSDFAVASRRLICLKNPLITIPVFSRSWHKKLEFDKSGKLNCSNVVMANGRGYILEKSRCGLCGSKCGLKERCSDLSCRARGDPSKPFQFHVTCARQAGFEVENEENVFYGT